MGIYRSNDPTTWDDVDGIIIDESAPSPNVAGVAANIAILVGQTQRGLSDLQEVGSIGQFFEMYGKDNSKGANKALKNKKFGRLRVIRVVASDAVVAELELMNSTTEVLKLTAKQGAGAYGNNIKVKVEAGTSTGRKYTVVDTTPGTVMQSEVYDNVTVASLASNNVFASSSLVNVTVLDSSVEPTVVALTALAGGDDGAIVDADYEDAIEKAQVEGAGNVLFLDSYNSVRNGYLKNHAAQTQDKMVICCGPESQTVSAAIADVASVRDTEGRIIYAYPWVQTVLDGVTTYVAPASFVASVISQTAPSIDPAYIKNAQFLGGVVGLKTALSRADYINLAAAGVMAFEMDSSVGAKIKSGVVTQIVNSELVTVLRRRMADFLTNSVGQFLKNYQNAVNSSETRLAVKAGMTSFVQRLQTEKLLPSEADVQGGKPYLIDVVSLNTNASVAAGFLKIIWKQRLFSSARYIVLSAEIGQSVIVQEQ